MESNTARKAAIELDILTESSIDPNNRPIIEPFRAEILALVEKFGKSGQSGGSAPYTASAISEAVKKLCLQEPICPITGEESEWSNEISGKELYQNNRCSALFKSNEDVYYLDAIVWKTQKGSTWSGTAKMENGTTVYSRQFVKSFPFKPKTFTVDVIEKEVSKDNWEFHVKDEEQLKEVFEYYDFYSDRTPLND